MRTHNSDTDTLIAALQADLPSDEQDARMRARLAAAGACVGASVAGSAALTASGIDAIGVGTASVGGAPSGVLAGTAAIKGAAWVAGVKSGLLSTLAATLPLAGGAGVKTLVVAGAIATGLGYPLWAPKVSTVFRSAVSQSAGQSERVDVQSERCDGRFSGVSSAPVRSEARAFDQTGVGMPAVARIAASPPQNFSDKGATPLRAKAMPSAVTLPHTRAQRIFGGPSIEPSEARVVAAPTNVGDVGASIKSPITEPTQARVVEANAPSGQATNVLAEETLLIERALRAERSGDKIAARNWLSVHQQRFPTGKLTIERNRMWAQLRD